MIFAIYRVSDGKIMRFMDAPVDHVDIQCSEGEEYFLNCPTSATHVLDNAPATLAPPPSPTFVLLVGIRAERDQRLAASDWTQLPDAVLSTERREAWGQYRQALRDFPETCNPENPIWPTPPT